MDDRDDELVVAVEQLARVQNRGDFQMSDGPSPSDIETPEHTPTTQCRVRGVRMATAEQRAAMSPELLDVVEYRKSGLSLNHIVGCRWTADTACGTCSTTSP